MVGAHPLELHGQLRNLQLEVVDQSQADVDGAPPRIREGEPAQQLAAGVTEQIADRARLAEGDQRAADAVLQAGAVAHQVQPKARQLTLAAHRWVGQPDRRHQVV